MNNLDYFDYDYTIYDGIAPPFVVRHDDETAQVVYARNEDDLPIRVPGFLVEAHNAMLLEDNEIVNLGLQYLAELRSHILPTNSTEN